MELADIFLAQAMDPFRIGLILMLAVTAARTERTMGSAIPLVLGVVFVAVLIPTAFGGDDQLRQIGVGLASNTLILGLVLAARFLFARLTRPQG